MGTIIDLEATRRRRDRRAFAFDLAAPGTYAAARGADPAAEWRPVLRPGATEGRIAARVALRAHERGVGREFALAVLRLVCEDGEPLDALETLARAAGSVRLLLDDVLDAAFDPRRDAELEAAAQTSSMNTISVESDRRGPSFRIRV